MSGETLKESLERAIKFSKERCNNAPYVPVKMEDALALLDMMNTIYLDHEFMKMLSRAASESEWIPEQYYANDWLSDCADFLRSGRGINAS